VSLETLKICPSPFNFLSRWSALKVICLGILSWFDSLPRFDTDSRVIVSFSIVNIADGNNVNPASAFASIFRVDIKISVGMIGLA
jgi:hypothetical protein